MKAPGRFRIICGTFLVFNILGGGVTLLTALALVHIWDSAVTNILGGLFFGGLIFISGHKLIGAGKPAVVIAVSLAILHSVAYPKLIVLVWAQRSAPAIERSWQFWVMLGIWAFINLVCLTTAWLFSPPKAALPGPDSMGPYR